MMGKKRNKWNDGLLKERVMGNQNEEGWEKPALQKMNLQLCNWNDK